MIDALRDRGIDAVVDDEPAFGCVLVDTEFKIAFTVKTSNRWGAAMRLESSELKAAIDSAVKTIIGNGEHADIWKQFLGQIEYPQQQLNH